ncbi:MAG: hypothetical protein A2152_01955 [Candidatus Levybacteria bacterium RBG_16_35_6]|nr:MAG: hypothetical protein A2152_01955 [Candidatus Levybacteria bacterium RBG_16_35_6]
MFQDKGISPGIENTNVNNSKFIIISICLAIAVFLCIINFFLYDKNNKFQISAKTQENRLHSLLNPIPTPIPSLISNKGTGRENDGYWLFRSNSEDLLTTYHGRFDEKIKYKFDYPDKWIINDHVRTVYITPGCWNMINKSSIAYSLELGTFNLTEKSATCGGQPIDRALSKSDSIKRPDLPIDRAVSRSSTTFASYPASRLEYKFLYRDGRKAKGVCVFFEKDGRLFSINALYNTWDNIDDFYNEHKISIEKIISTFSFY